MPKTDIKIENAFQNIDDLIENVEKKLEKEKYHFLKIAFDQQLIFCNTDTEKYSLIEDYVSLEPVCNLSDPLYLDGQIR